MYLLLIQLKALMEVQELTLVNILAAVAAVLTQHALVHLVIMQEQAEPEQQVQ